MSVDQCQVVFVDGVFVHPHVVTDCENKFPNGTIKAIYLSYMLMF